MFGFSHKVPNFANLDIQIREFESKFANLAKFAYLVQIREFGRILKFANLKNEFATMIMTILKAIRDLIQRKNLAQLWLDLNLPICEWRIGRDWRRLALPDSDWRGMEANGGNLP